MRNRHRRCSRSLGIDFCYFFRTLSNRGWLMNQQKRTAKLDIYRESLLWRFWWIIFFTPTVYQLFPRLLENPQKSLMEHRFWLNHQGNRFFRNRHLGFKRHFFWVERLHVFLQNRVGKATASFESTVGTWVNHHWGSTRWTWDWITWPASSPMRSITVTWAFEMWTKTEEGFSLGWLIFWKLMIQPKVSEWKLFLTFLKPSRFRYKDPQV